MPFKSAKQARLMRAVAHSPGFARKVGIKQSVGQDFVAEDKKRPSGYAAGGAVGCNPARGDGAAIRGRTRGSLD